MSFNAIQRRTFDGFKANDWTDASQSSWYAVRYDPDHPCTFKPLALPQVADSGTEP